MLSQDIKADFSFNVLEHGIITTKLVPRLLYETFLQDIQHNKSKMSLMVSLLQKFVFKI